MVLIDFAQAGVVKGYARLVETVDANGTRHEVRDGRIDRELWRRIVEEGKARDVATTGTVRLESSGRSGGAPAVSIIGIRFDERSVNATLSHHASDTEGPRIAPQAASTAERAGALPQSECSPRPTLDADAMAISVAQAATALGVCRSTVYNMIDRGDLVAKKIGARTLITTESIRAFLAS